MVVKMPNELNIKKRLLLVMENNILRKMYADILQVNGYEVISAENGADAITLYIEFKPELVLMDSFLPKVNGVDSFLEIKEFDNNAKIILFQDSTDKKIIYDDLKNDAALILTKKPSSINSLLELAKY
jgi:two-component system chemotaxis response regulator CheY